MQHEFLAPGGRGAQLLVETHFLPALHRFRFFLRQAGAHRKIRLRKIEGGGVVQFFCGVAHDHTVVARRAGRAISIAKRANSESATSVCHRSAKIPDLPALSERAEGRANNSANLNCKFQPVLGHGRLFMRFSGKKEEKSDGKGRASKDMPRSLLKTRSSHPLRSAAAHPTASPSPLLHPA